MGDLFSAGGRGGRQRPRAEDEVVDERATTEAVRYLTPDLKEFLADLEGVPVSLAQAAIQLLPFGSRILLLETGMATAEVGGEDSAIGLRLTPLGFAVILRVAQDGDHDEIRALAEAAAAIVETQTALRDGRPLPAPPSVPPPSKPRVSWVSQSRPR